MRLALLIAAGGVGYAVIAVGVARQAFSIQRTWGFGAKGSWPAAAAVGALWVVMPVVAAGKKALGQYA